MRSGVLARRVVSVALILGVGAAITSNSACVLLDAPADLPLAPTRRPTILRSQVTPSASMPLGQIPADGIFIVPIEIPDPTQPVAWTAYLDLDTPRPQAAADDARIVKLTTIVGSSSAPNIAYPTFTLKPARVDSTTCHTIHFVVSLQLSDNPDPSLSDSIDWFVVPGGNPGGCTSYDGGGVYGVIPEAGVVDDAGDGQAD